MIEDFMETEDEKPADSDFEGKYLLSAFFGVSMSEGQDEGEGIKQKLSLVPQKIILVS